MTCAAVVITGAAEEHAPIFRAFAEDLFHAQEYDLIQYPGVERALARIDPCLMPLCEQFTIRDIVRTKAYSAWLKGARSCMLIGCIPHNPGELGYEECEQLLVRERREVADWHLFPEVEIAAFTPRRAFVPIIHL